MEEALKRWITQELELAVNEATLHAVAFNGQTLCRTLRDFSPAVPLLAAVDHQTGYVLSQRAVDQKTNEHKAALELLKTLVWDGRVLTGDAMFCQRDLCEAIVESGGDDFFQVKENQPNLLRDIQHEFAADEAAFPPWGQKLREAERQTHRQVEKGHGQLEIREITSTVELNDHLDWPQVGQGCRIERTRQIGDERQYEVAYFVTSLKPSRANAETLLPLSREHWAAIENGVHDVRDTTLAAFRNAALNWLRQLGPDNLAATIRSFPRNSQRLFTLLGIVPICLIHAPRARRENAAFEAAAILFSR